LNIFKEKRIDKMKNYLVSGGSLIMDFISKYSYELILLFVFYIVRVLLNSKLVKNQLKIKYYILINILIMITILLFVIYMRRSIEFMLGVYIVFIILDIYELLIKRHLKKKSNRM
jgi:hypothetical protein